MKRFTIFLALLGLTHLLVAQAEWVSGKVDYHLGTKLEADPTDYYPVLIFMADRLDMVEMNRSFNKLNTSREDRTYTVITSLKAKAAETQPPVLEYLNTANGVDIGSIKAYWIANIIYVKANGQAIAGLSHMEAIEEIQLYIPPAAADMKVSSAPMIPKRAVGGHEPGHDAINATGMWAMGYTGIGRKAYIIDSGTDITHPALSANFYGNFVDPSLAWEGYSTFTPLPFDCDNTPGMGNHGTHVTGTVLGLDRNTNDTIGVAPNAFWMSAATIGCNGSSILDALQWAIDPDGNPGTIDDQPDVINNSWTDRVDPVTQMPVLPAPCNSSGQQGFNSVEAAGIAAVTSAGNAGAEGVSSVTSPANNSPTLVNSFAVGAVSPTSLNLGGFSSRGPALCPGLTGSLAIKPEVVAPGVNIRSSTVGSYAAFSGTSMASPHVAGAIVLLREAFPTLTGEALKLALYNTAVDLGATGEDNNYGNGIIDVVAAFNYLVGQGNTPVPPPSLDKDISIRSIDQQGDKQCSADLIPVLTIRNDGKTAVSTIDFNYDVVDGPSGSFQWTGSIAPGQSQTINLSAINLSNGKIHYFDVSINLVDGVADAVEIDNKASGSIIIFGDEEPVSDPVNACTGFPIIISASYSDPTAVLRWFPSQNSNNGLGDGFQFVTPPLTATQSYHIGVIRRENVGPADKGIGFNLPAAGNYLTFNAFTDLTLKSVKVFANGAGSRSIQLQNSDGVTLESKILQVPDGESVVNLNMNVPKGNEYRLALGGTLGNLWTSTGSISYPYEVASELVEITGSNNGLFNYFFDWVVEYEISCDRAFTFATVSGGSVTPGFTVPDTVHDISQGAGISFTNTSSGGSQYFWSFGDGATSTQQNPNHVYTSPGLYTVGLSVTGNDNCSAATSMTIRATGEYPFNVGIKDELNIGNIDIIPNPSTGQFQVLFDLNQRIEADIEVFDMLGKRIMGVSKKSYQQDKLDINLTNHSDGIYYLKVHFEGNQIVKKLVLRND